MSNVEALWEETWVNINGEFVKGPDATVSVLDWSFVYGDGIFEGVAITEGRILKLDAHIDRLYRSAKRVGIEIPLTKSEMAARWLETARRNEMREGYMRPLVSRGTGALGIHSLDSLSEPTVVVIPQRHRTGSYDRVDARHARISSVRSPSPVSRDPRVKANHYLPNILAVRELADTPADIPIFLDDNGFVTEAGSANVFVVSNDGIRTPPVTHILPGTTRQAILELGETGAIPRVTETNLTPYDLVTADECFISGSLKGITAITELNSEAIGEGIVGERTREFNDILTTHLVETGTPIFED